MKTFILLACFASCLVAADEAIPAPGTATPVTAATPGTYEMTWTEGFDGNLTKILIGAAQGNRNLALVITKDSEKTMLATYPAVAFLDKDKVLHVDGRGAPLTEDSEADYSPDSFAIGTDGKVRLMDDNENSAAAKITSSPGK